MNENPEDEWGYLLHSHDAPGGLFYFNIMQCRRAAVDEFVSCPQDWTGATWFISSGHATKARVDSSYSEQSLNIEDFALRRHIHTFKISRDWIFGSRRSAKNLLFP